MRKYLLTAMISLGITLESIDASAQTSAIYGAAKTAYVYNEFTNAEAMKRCSITYDGIRTAAKKGLQRTGLMFYEDWDVKGDLGFYVNVILTESCIASVSIETTTYAREIKVAFSNEAFSRIPVPIVLNTQRGVISGPSKDFALRLYQFLTELGEKIALVILEGVAKEKRWNDDRKRTEQ